MPDIAPLLNHKAGKTVLLGVAAPGSGAIAEQTVDAGDEGRGGGLAYRRWIEQRRAIVKELSGGRLGYVHVAAMNDDEMHKVFAELMGRYGDAEGAVVDVRFNTGRPAARPARRLPDRHPPFRVGTRNGVELGLSPYDRWARPTALVQNAFSYSDGSIFPAYYKREALGPIVGDRVPGTGTAVYNITAARAAAGVRRGPARLPHEGGPSSSRTPRSCPTSWSRLSPTSSCRRAGPATGSGRQGAAGRDRRGAQGKDDCRQVRRPNPGTFAVSLFQALRQVRTSLNRFGTLETGRITVSPQRLASGRFGPECRAGFMSCPGPPASRSRGPGAACAVPAFGLMNSCSEKNCAKAGISVCRSRGVLLPAPWPV